MHAHTHRHTPASTECGLGILSPVLGPCLGIVTWHCLQGGEAPSVLETMGSFLPEATRGGIHICLLRPYYVEALC